jgi:hypothetical protein
MGASGPEDAMGAGRTAGGGPVDAARAGRTADGAPVGGAAGASAAAELELGILLGMDPRPALTETTTQGVASTTSSSWWNRTLCGTCGHTFRRGDRVLLDQATRVVRHLVPGLDCGTDPEGTAQEEGNDRAELAAGLLSAWPGEARVVRLEADDWRIPRRDRRTGGPAPVCLYCAHTFRGGEYVVVCPCSPRAAICEVAVHRDPAAGLPCWERWRPTGGVAVCPTTRTRL